jgi:hypothetical protein
MTSFTVIPLYVSLGLQRTVHPFDTCRAKQMPGRATFNSRRLLVHTPRREVTPRVMFDRQKERKACCATGGRAWVGALLQARCRGRAGRQARLRKDETTPPRPAPPLDRACCPTWSPSHGLAREMAELPFSVQPLLAPSVNLFHMACAMTELPFSPPPPGPAHQLRNDGTAPTVHLLAISPAPAIPLIKLLCGSAE